MKQKAKPVGYIIFGLRGPMHLEPLPKVHQIDDGPRMGFLRPVHPHWLDKLGTTPSVTLFMDPQQAREVIKENKRWFEGYDMWSEADHLHVIRVEPVADC